jgi:hypothetical protein
MDELETRLKGYLEVITGGPVACQEMANAQTTRLPLYLRSRYRLQSAVLLGEPCLMALQVSGGSVAAPNEYAAHARTLAEQFSGPVTLVIPRVTSYQRNQMVRAGTPFIVPGSQLFMPFRMVDLRERFAATHSVAGKGLSPAAQCILLYQLQRQPLNGIPLRDIARICGYSAMMVSRVKEEWEAAGLCRAQRTGRSVSIEFTAGGRPLWNLCAPLFSSPVRKTHWVDWKQPGQPALKSGFTALSRSTLIEDDAIPTWAMSREAFRELGMKGTFHTVGGPEAASARIEEWSYEPALLGDGSTVDPLSLVLSLRHHTDERVQQQLESLLATTLPH